jgi:hypothetical protein
MPLWHRRYGAGWPFRARDASGFVSVRSAVHPRAPVGFPRLANPALRPMRSPRPHCPDRDRLMDAIAGVSVAPAALRSSRAVSTTAPAEEMAGNSPAPARARMPTPIRSWRRRIASTQPYRLVDLDQRSPHRYLLQVRVMAGSSAAVVRRVVSGLIILAMLSLPGAWHSTIPSSHLQIHCETQSILSASGQVHSIGSSHSHHDMTAEACCLGSSCIVSAIAASPHHAVRVAWSPVYYWTVDTGGRGIRPSPDLGPPIALG